MYDSVLQYCDTDEDPTKYVCRCGAHICTPDGLIWEGFMGENEPALLFQEVVNLMADADSQRQEKLSTGTYTIVNVKCRSCQRIMGWKYLWSENFEYKYKEGTFLLSVAALKFVDSTGSMLSSGPMTNY